VGVDDVEALEDAILCVCNLYWEACKVKRLVEVVVVVVVAAYDGMHVAFMVPSSS